MSDDHSIDYSNYPALFLEVCYQSLGGLLEKISDDSAVQSSPTLSKWAQDAILFHRDLQQQYELVIEENQTFGKRIVELEKALHPHPLTVDEMRKKQMEAIERYKTIRECGGTPEFILKIAQAEDFDEIRQIGILQRVFDLTFEEAETIHQCTKLTK